MNGTSKPFNENFVCWRRHALYFIVFEAKKATPGKIWGWHVNKVYIMH
jgi:hypothetical protein